MAGKRTGKSNSTTSTVYFTTDTDRWRRRRHMVVEGCMLVQCTEGEVELSINSHSHLLRKGMFAVLIFDMVTVVNRKSDDFAMRAVIAGFDLSQDVFFTSTSAGMWDTLYAQPIFEVVPELAGLYDRWFEYVGQIQLSAPDPMRNTLLRKEMESFFAFTSFLCQKIAKRTETDSENNRAWSLAIDFMGLLNRHYTHHHDVAFYANRLGITPNYLNIISRRYAGLSAKEQINLLITLAVKSLLETTDMSVKGISERLNFDDSSYLCRIFRKRTGMSPTEYRKQLKLSSNSED
ncbi:MAG: helix-turn-helix transcriptional regulator [Muribaculaceae bacterium]|nr:helix-turn-helix transcriptional regulator [Muribaculaceae bacterium]